MRNILIVDAVSTGYNFVADVAARGFFPIVMESQFLRSAAGSMEVVEDRIFCDYKVIAERDTYEETLALVKLYDPLLVLAGGESGVVLATCLAESLGLPGNPIAILDRMKSKAVMQQALCDAGLRFIRGCVVSSVAEAKAFLEENHLSMGVVKPTIGASSNGVTLCNSIPQVLEAVALALRQRSMDPIYRQVLVQERIVGTEYVVNTMSCAGKHRISSMFQYEKIHTAEGGAVYNGEFNLLHLEMQHEALATYALQAVKAIGIQYGSVHGEYMIDEKGPVLIEVNCRPMGGGNSAGFLDLLFGQHETDSVLDCFLDPEKFAMDAAKPYGALRQAYQKDLIIPYDADVSCIPLWTIAEQLRSVYDIFLPDRNTRHFFCKTQDLSTEGGLICMVHDDAAVVKADYELLCELERDYFALAFSEGISRPWFIKQDVISISMADLLDVLQLHGSVLAICEEKPEIPMVCTALPEDVPDIRYAFDAVVILLDETIIAKRETDLLELFFAMMKKAKEGGKVYIPEATYQYLTYGRRGAELLLRVLGFEGCESPALCSMDFVVGKRGFGR